MDHTGFLLIAPYGNDLTRWPAPVWRNRYDPDGPSYNITTDKESPADEFLGIVQSYADVLHQYRLHPEYKFRGSNGQCCNRLTKGVLVRRPVHLTNRVRLIGKETNRLDEVQAGLIGTLGDVLTKYDDPSDRAFHRLVMPVLDRYSGRELAYLVGSDRRTIDRVRRGQLPRAILAARLGALAEKQARLDIERGPRPMALADNRDLLLTAWRWWQDSGAQPPI